MPKSDVTTERRQSLIDAAILTIGEQGSLDVTVREIASRAGMSSALAFHYFGGKDGIIIETMRHLLREFAMEVRAGLAIAETPRARLEAVIRASFSPSQFEKTTIAAWLVFYLHAYSSAPAARLLQVYTRRLKSNLVDALCVLMQRERALLLAEGLAAMIDGSYVRHALRPQGPDAGEAIASCLDYLETHIPRGETR